MNKFIAQAVEFTKTYKEYKDAPIPVREAMCYKVQYPGLLPGPWDGDVFAGRCSERHLTLAGAMRWYGMPDYTPENITGGKHGGYCFDFAALFNLECSDEDRKVLEELDAFWRINSTMARVRSDPRNEFTFDTGFLTPNDLATIVKRGLPGLIDDVKAMEEGDFRSGLLLAFEAVEDVFRFYIEYAQSKGFKEIAKNISALLERAPATLAEALQLILIFELLTHERHYEMHQLDVAVGDVYAKELENGTITEEQAIFYIQKFYEMINENGDVTVCRLVLGGKGRQNAENADLFIKAALKAEQRHKRVTPQLTLRIYSDMDPDILKLAYDTVCETGTLPLFYNDDVVIPGVAEAFDLSLEKAANYYPVGCGEFVLGYDSPALLITNWNIPITVDEAMRECSNAETFEDLYKSVLKHIKRHADKLARYNKLVVDTHNENSVFLIPSAVINDCLSRNKPLLNGGARYIGSSIMGHGYTNAADALTAIKKLVYEEKTYTLDEIIKALDANFEGYENIHKTLLDVPKYGNDDEEADMMVSKLWRDLSNEAKRAGTECGFDFLAMASANPSGHFMGKAMGATADGRLKGMPYAICNSPTAGNDKSGLTALLNSIMRTDPANGGATTNFKLSHEFISKEREKFDALFATYWAGGGQQASITILNKGDLEAAMENPENYSHVLVRLGGWTARFIDLDRYIQEEILTRTLY